MINLRKAVKTIAGVVMSLTLACAAVPVTMASASTITFLQGDVSGDGAVSIADATLLTRYLSGDVAVDSNQLTRMDVVQNKVIEKQDYNKIVGYCTGLATPQNVTAEQLTVLYDESRWYYKHNNGSSPASYRPYMLYESTSTSSVDFTNPVLSDFYEDNENANTVKLTVNGGATLLGTGFIVDNNIIATAAHCVYDKATSEFVNGIAVNVYNEDMTILEGTYQATATHIPQLFVTSSNGYQDSYDYALICVNDDLIDEEGYEPWALGCITDEFIQQETGQLITSGFTNNQGTIPETRYYSKGTIIDYNENSQPHNIKDLRLNTNATVYGSQSGSPTYYEANYNGTIVKTAVGVTTGGGEGFVWACRMTPILLRFYLNNTNT